jgi:hypothetical protein
LATKTQLIRQQPSNKHRQPKLTSQWVRCLERIAADPRHLDRKRTGPAGPNQRLSLRQHHRRTRFRCRLINTSLRAPSPCHRPAPDWACLCHEQEVSKERRDAQHRLNNYILPNADDQFDMLIKLRLWGVYASVYGSMPMMYDYRVDKAYIGPTCYLIDPRCIAPVDGLHNVQQAGCFISTIITSPSSSRSWPEKRPATTSLQSKSSSS